MASAQIPMTCPEPALYEAERLAALDRYGILDTGREAAFDDIAELAADILDAPIAVVNFIASDRQWFKAEVGIGTDTLPLDVSICRHAILQPDVFVVPDLTKDARFKANPLVEAVDGLRFYAGALLETPDGLPLGTVCVLDTKERPEGISARQERALRTLAGQTMAQLELRRSEALERDHRARAEKHARRLSLLAQASSLLLTATDTAQAVRELFGLAVDEFRLDVGFYYRCSGGGLGLVAAVGLAPEQERAAARLEFGQTVCGIVAETREAVLLADIQRAGNPHATFLKNLGLDSYFSAPLLARGELLGTLSFGRKQDSFTAGEVEALRALVAQVGTAADRIEAEAALAAEVRALGRLQKVSTRLVADEAPQALYDAILEAAADLMGSECASLQTLDEAGDLQLLAHRGYDPRSVDYWQKVDATSGSTCGIALTTGERVVVPDVENSGLAFESGDLQSYRWTGMRAVQTTPLLSRSGKPLGMLSTLWKRPHTPSTRDFRLFDVLARQAADAIERTTAQAELRESEARQAFLLSLADALRTLKTPAAIASLAAERVGERFGLSRAFYAEFIGSLMRVERDFTNGVASIVGEHDLEAFGPDLLSAYHNCPTVRVDDVRTDARFGDEARSGLLARQVGAYLDVILFEEELRVSLLALQSATPRTWTASEESLFREVGERVKAAIERARAEDRLRELNETLERRVEAAIAERDQTWNNSRDMLLVVGTDGVFRAVNPAWSTILGWRAEELVGRSYLEFIHPDDHPSSKGALETASRAALTAYENRYRHKDDTFRWISWVAAPQGNLIYASGRDITAEKERQAELEAAQEALRQSQKMEAMGQLTGGVAHDFNNLLTPIVGSLDMLLRKGIGGEREQRLIAGAAQSAERAKTLVQRLLAFSRRQPLQPVPVDVAKLVAGMADLVSSTTGPQIEVVVDASDGLPSAKADPNQLEMALLNLSVNARDAMPNGGTLRITARAERVAAAHSSGLRPGHYVKLSVADTGVGMDEATLARAIEPFFSTKGVGKGTGLGLSMVHGLASQLGGTLTIRSRPGLGTRIELWLPVTDAPAETAGAVAQAIQPATTVGTALLVDDEELVRMSTADLLGDLGYAVVEAASAEEALRSIRGGLRPDLLITDHLMPGMNGTDLARIVRSEHADVQVLLVSGYAESEGVAPDLPRLTKPFRRDELATSLAQLHTAG